MLSELNEIRTGFQYLFNRVENGNRSYRANRIVLKVKSIRSFVVRTAIEIIGGPGRTRTCNQTVMSDAALR